MRVDDWETYDEIVDGMLTLKLDATTTNDYANGHDVMVTATDANRQRAITTVTVMPNRAPRVLTAIGEPDEDGALPGENASYVIGTMSGEVDPPRTAGVASCSMFNECAITLFEDDEAGYSIEVTSDEEGKYSWRVEDEELTLIGLQSTWDADADPDAVDDPIMVEVKAEDANGLSIEVSFMLTVNAAPTVGDDADGVDRSIEIARDATGDALILMSGTNAAGLFEDTEGDVRTGSFTSSTDSIVEINETTGVMELGARGTATITVRGTTGTESQEVGGLGQYAEFTISVRVR